MNKPEETWIEWLDACIEDPYSGKRMSATNLGMLTGQDKRALAAIDACWQLYASSDDDGAQAALKAVPHLLSGMQPKCWPFARDLIARAMDWNDRDSLWPAVYVPALERMQLKESEADANGGIVSRRRRAHARGLKSLEKLIRGDDK